LIGSHSSSSSRLLRSFNTKGHKRIERGWGIRESLISEPNLGKIKTLADNLEEGPLTVLIVIEIGIIKLRVQILLFATIAGKMAIGHWHALPKRVSI
jgi:hypothetical protein